MSWRPLRSPGLYHKIQTGLTTTTTAQKMWVIVVCQITLQKKIGSITLQYLQIYGSNHTIVGVKLQKHSLAYSPEGALCRKQAGLGRNKRSLNGNSCILWGCRADFDLCLKP